MKVLKNKWVIPVAAAVITLSIAGAAYAATGASTGATTAAAGVVTIAGTGTTATAETTCPMDGDGVGYGYMGGRDGDETTLTGDTLEKVKAAALAAAGTGSTLMWATTDDDGISTYEAHVRKADGTCVEMYLDASFKVVKTEAMAERGGEDRGYMGGGRMGEGHMGDDRMRGGSDDCDGDCDGDGPTAPAGGPTGATTTGAI